MRILFLTTLLPGARRSGGEVASQAFVDALRELGHRVSVVAYRRAGDAPVLHDDDVAVADRHIETGSAGARPLLWMARAIASNRAYSVAKYVSRDYSRAAARDLRASPPSLVVVDHAQTGWVVPQGGWDVPYVYLAHNVEHRLYADAAAAGGWRRRVNLREAALIREQEEALCRHAHGVWALTADDAAALAELGAGTRALPFDLPAARDPGAPGAANCDVAVLGSWTWQANAAGLEWFLEAVRPKLPGEMTVEVGGSFSEELAGAAPGVRARGRVPDAMAFLQSGRAVAVPSVSGAGVQVKTLDAIASGRPVVATSVAMRGISALPPTVTVRDDAAGFAEALVEAAAQPVGGDAVKAAREWVDTRRRAFRDQLRSAVEAVNAGAGAYV